MKRCIMIVPKFKNGNIIAKIREKYDPTVKFVEPHVTLVFPFESDISSEDIKEHTINAIKNAKPFELTLQGIGSDKSFGNYIFLKITKGTEILVDLHKNLYKGILEKYYPHWPDDAPFTPHMTIGNFKTKEELADALEELKVVTDTFTSIADEVTIEIIDENSNSIIEALLKLS
ncbi:MAG: 2'-5' RNA ligase family protein [Sarcina sp.]